MDPSAWDGAAISMGNSTKTWRQSYAPTLKSRTVQGVVDGYSNFTSQVSGGEGGVMCPHTKPRISSALSPLQSPTPAVLPSPSSQRSNTKMAMPFMCLPQPDIGEVDAILVDGLGNGKKRKIESRPMGRQFDWGGEWGGW